jgi:acetyl esterase/lipase
MASSGQKSNEGTEAMKTKQMLVVLVLVLAAAAALGKDVPVQKNIVYGRAGGVELKLDLATPAPTPAPVPAVLCVHGGGWSGGSKDGYTDILKQFAAHGYVAAAVEYRFVPQYPWPAQIEDVKCAVRWLRAHAKELNLDPDRIAAMGDSAGGHLSLMLGLMDPKDDLEGDGGNPGFSSKVQAVVNKYGPTDMRVWRPVPEPGKTEDLSGDLLMKLVGTKDRSAPAVLQLSPIHYIDANDPPILTFHGSADNLVPVEQAKLLHEALKKAGVREKLVIVEGAGHGWGGRQFTDTQRQTMAFLDSVFKFSPPEK